MRLLLFIFGMILLCVATPALGGGVKLYDQFNNSDIAWYWIENDPNNKLTESIYLDSGTQLGGQTNGVSTDVFIGGDFEIIAKIQESHSIDGMDLGEANYSDQSVYLYLHNSDHYYSVRNHDWYRITGIWPDYSWTDTQQTMVYRDGNLLYQAESDLPWIKIKSSGGTISVYLSAAYEPTTKEGTWTLATTEVQDGDHRNFSNIEIIGGSYWFDHAGHGQVIYWRAEYLKAELSGGKGVKALW